MILCRGLKYSKNGDVLYNEDISYVSPVTAKVNNISHSYKELDSKGDVDRNYDYEYDLLGRLERVSGSKVSKYTHDILGRMTYKKEDGSTVDYEYGDGFYRPVSFGVKGAASKAYFDYDASGNVWMDRYNKTAYKLNDAGQPVKGYKFGSFSSGITLNQVNEDNVSSSDYDASVAMSYDEGGNRLWFSFDNDNISYAEATMPSIGVYKRASLSGSDFELARLDLLGGGYRLLGTDGDGAAYFPITDVQGNVRAYANKSGIVSAYDYLPYGTVLPIVQSGAADDNRWQGKEFDNETGKFYFGARYYDPVFGMWMSPDPARQFANPYTFGGDPVNFVDPDGRDVLGWVLLASLAIYLGYEAYEEALKHNFSTLSAGFIGIAVGGFTLFGGGVINVGKIGGEMALGGAFALGANIFTNYSQGNGMGSFESNAKATAIGMGLAVFGKGVSQIKPVPEKTERTLSLYAASAYCTYTIGKKISVETYGESGGGFGINFDYASYALNSINYSSSASFQSTVNDFSSYTPYSEMEFVQRDLYMMNGDIYEYKYGQFIPVDFEKERIQQNTINEMNDLNQRISDMNDYIYQYEYKFEMPEMPQTPQIDIPDVVIPEIKIEIPEFKSPKIDIPQMNSPF